MTQIVLPLDVAIHLKDLLLRADSEGVFGTCDDHPQASGKGCRVCTSLEALEMAVHVARTPIPE